MWYNEIGDSMKKIFPFLLTFLVFSFIILDTFRIIPDTVFYDDDFGFERLKSNLDKDSDSIDDYQDIVEGAREYVSLKPPYKSAYYKGGYPLDEYTVCTDVIWYAFSNAGYDLKSMVDEDIKNNLEEYTTIEKPDPNIDFRRVRNLKIFFDRHAISLTTDTRKKEEWQGGDIVIFEGHIAIISDKRNRRGTPYLIHQSRRPNKEEDFLVEYSNYHKILGHYRFNPSIKY